MKILIIKLGALGDVLRTTPLLTEFKRRYPDSRIDWLVNSQCREALLGNLLIDSLIFYSDNEWASLKKSEYDLAVNLDKDKEALDSIEAVSAKKKMGFGRSKSGKLCALDGLSDYAYRLGIDDDLKFKKNKKTYQEISFEQVGFSFNGEDYVFSVSEEDRDFARTCLENLGVHFKSKKRPVIGLNTGSGNRFAGKRLPVETFLKLIQKFFNELHADVILFGGKDEIERNKEITSRSQSPVINAGSHGLKHFAAIIGECDLVVSGDTTAMHIAIAMKVPVAAYFASTCASEIELYSRGRKIVSGIECSPCYKQICPIDEQCMKDMSAESIFSAAKEILEETRVR